MQQKGNSYKAVPLSFFLFHLVKSLFPSSSSWSCPVAQAPGHSLNLAGVNRWFHVDDIAILYIFKIAELYGLKVRITATPKNKAT